jgi:hypothetical protein
MIKKLVIPALIAVLLLSACGSNRKEASRKAKPAQKDKQVLRLDEAMLADESTASVYAGQLVLQATDCLLQSVMYGGSSDFPSLSQAFDLSKNHVSWSEETAWQAFGLRQMVVAARAEASAQGAGLAGSEEALQGENLQAQMDAKLKEGVQLQDSQRDFFLASLIYLAAAVVKETNISKNLPDYISWAKSLKGFDALREAQYLPKALALMSGLPGMIASQTMTLKTYLDIAKTNNIEIPSDVKSMLP